MLLIDFIAAWWMVIAAWMFVKILAGLAADNSIDGTTAVAAAIALFFLTPVLPIVAAMEYFDVCYGGDEE